MARLPVSYTSSLSFCYSSHVVVYFILLSVVSIFCSGLCGIFSSHTGQHEKLVPVSPVHTEYTLHILSNHFCVNRHFLLFYLTNEMFISNNLVMYLCIKQLLNDDAWLLYEQVYYYKLSS